MRSIFFSTFGSPRLPGLFLKIFLGVWAAMTVAGILLLAIEAERSERAAQHWRRVINDSFAFYAVSAVKEFNEGGEAGAREFLAELQGRTRIHAWLFDEQGREISGHASAKLATDSHWITNPMRRLAERSRHSGRTELERVSGSTLAVYVVHVPDGHHYVLVGELPALRYGLWYAQPSLQAVRLLAVLVMAGMISWVLGSHLTTPIEKLRAATQRLSEGDLEARAGIELGERSDELGQLSRDFDRMAERIGFLLSEQERLMEARQRFMRDVSHELRSPLARLTVALDLARDRAEEMVPLPSLEESQNTPLSKVHDRIEREAGRLSELIDRLLALSRLESGAQKKDTAPIDLAAMVNMVVADADFEARSKGCVVSVTIHKDSSAQAYLTSGTGELLRSAIENVVRNAVRHSPEHTVVEVSLKRDQGWAIITVRDHGPGVPQHELGELFQPFFRTGRARSQDREGTGLGLAITERAVHLQGGLVQASNATDGGLIVRIRLPLSVEDHAMTVL